MKQQFRILFWAGYWSFFFPIVWFRFVDVQNKLAFTILMAIFGVIGGSLFERFRCKWKKLSHPGFLILFLSIYWGFLLSLILGLLTFSGWNLSNIPSVFIMVSILSFFLLGLVLAAVGGTVYLLFL